jgi:AcrR family transcriptional regulator
MGIRAEAVAATRERIARAALRLMSDQPYEDVTLNDIAAAAGVSHQTVLNHYESKEGAALAAVELVKGETQASRRSVVPGDPDRAIAVLMEQYEQFGDLNVRWAMSAERLGRLAVVLDDARAAHQRWLDEVFVADLPQPPAERRRVVNALTAATDVYIWKLLRRDLRLSRRETTRTMTTLVRGVLGPTRLAVFEKGKDGPSL